VATGLTSSKAYLSVFVSPRKSFPSPADRTFSILLKALTTEEQTAIYLLANWFLSIK